MRKAKYTRTTCVYFTVKRRPESARHGDERGRVWFHKFAWLDSVFFRAPCFVKTRKFSFQEAAQ